MAVAKFTGAYVLAETPHSSVSQMPGMPAACISAYHLEAEAGDTLDTLVERHYTDYPVGASLIVVDEKYVVKKLIKPTLVDAS